MVKKTELFWSFFKIGTFTLGGGYAMIPLMQREIVDKKKWIDEGEFIDILSLSQAMPGTFAINMATNVGYKLKGVSGALISIIGNIIAPIFIILTIAIFFQYFNGNPIVESIFKGIRPAVVALIAVPVFQMTKTAKINWRNLWIPIVCAMLIWLLGISPVIIIIVAALGGFIYGRIKNRKVGKK